MSDIIVLSKEDLRKNLKEILQETLPEMLLKISANPNYYTEQSSLKVYRRKELAKLFGVTVQTINSWVRTGQLPKPTKVGRIPIFSHDQIESLLINFKTK